MQGVSNALSLYLFSPPSALSLRRHTLLYILYTPTRNPGKKVWLDVPAQCQTDSAHPTTDCPVVFCFHGFGGNASKYAEQAGPALHEHGMIGIYPQGDAPPGSTHPGWNDGQGVMDWHGNLQCPWNDTAGPPWCTKDMNDLNFTAEIATAIESLGGTGHKFSYGVSNGADHSERIAANSVVAFDALPFMGIAANSGGLMATPPRAGPGPWNWNYLNPGRPVAQLAFHGTNDTVIPYNGGPKFGNATFVSMSEPESDKTWAVHNGCSMKMSETTVPAIIAGGAASTAILHKYEDCPPTAPVGWYEVVNGHHGAALMLNGKELIYAAVEFFAMVNHALVRKA